MLTIANADRGKPTLKDDERFRTGLFHDLDNRTLMYVYSIKSVSKCVIESIRLVFTCVIELDRKMLFKCQC